MNNHGQITAEYMLLITIIVIVLISISNAAIHESEKNTIMESAQIGAQIGVDKNAYAMYYNDTFNNYENNYPKLLNPIDIRVINITMENSEDTITLEVYLHSNNFLTYNEKYIVGYRVNYYVRKTISETFDRNVNDLYYENLSSNNYKIETKEVKWV